MRDRIDTQVLSKILKLGRKESGLTLPDISVRSSLSEKYIGQLENGKKRNPTISALSRLAFALNIDIHVLMKLIMAKISSKEQPTGLKITDAHIRLAIQPGYFKMTFEVEKKNHWESVVNSILKLSQSKFSQYQ